MVRSLYTAASGMTSQQTNVDTISNNLANVNTAGYKMETTQFKTLLYQNLQPKTTTANGENKPVAAQVGLGTRVSAISSIYTQGAITPTESNTDFAIAGDGFFGIMGEDGNVYYTRSGNFFFSRATEGYMLCTADGLPVMSSDNQEIVLGEEYNPENLQIDTNGELMYPSDENNGNLATLGVKIGIFQFSNPGGLSKTGSSLLSETEASGVALNEANGETMKVSTLKQGYIESSNVSVANEMVNLITAQRAYELCSKAITTSDTMMEQANNLKR